MKEKKNINISRKLHILKNQAQITNKHYRYDPNNSFINDFKLQIAKNKIKEKNIPIYRCPRLIDILDIKKDNGVDTVN